MELLFERKSFPCLRRNVWEVQNQEQTLEVRLPDGMPDIGTILGAWGQCVLRSKEWRSDAMNVSGGVMAWVLYAPSDGSEPRSIEAWLPLQMKWNFPETRREGTIRTSMLLRGVDARTLSARKMMVRANVSVLGEALEPWETEISTPENVPEDVQLLKRTYPMELPKEAGEKTFLVDEELVMSPGSAAPEKIVSFAMVPQVNEQKVLGGKAVFRGNGNFHMLYYGKDGQLYSCDFEVPFSQFSDLDRDYDKEATLNVMMAISSLEPELQEDRVRLKCGMVAQYLVHDRCLVELVEDAYSTNRPVTAEMQQLELPMVLDQCRQTLRYEAEIPAEAGRVVDVSVYPEHPVVHRAGELTELEINGGLQVLYYDSEGNLQSGTSRWNENWECPIGETAMVLSTVQSDAPAQAVSGAGKISIRGEMSAETAAIAGQGMPMVTALTLGERQQADPARPSLILRRAGEGSLWELAKTSGSTVEAIRKANQLNDEPLDDRLLLIPVS